MERLGEHLGSALPVVDVDGDQWGDYLQRVMGPKAPRSYPTVLYVYPDGRIVRFDNDRTERNLVDFACSHSSQC